MWDAEARILAMSTSRASRPSSLVNNLHCCNRIQDLKRTSAGLDGKVCSIVNLFLIVQRAQHKAPKPIQNTLLVTPTKTLDRILSSEKDEGFQDTWSQDLTQLHTNLANTQWKKCVPCFPEHHKGDRIPSPDHCACESGRPQEGGL